MLNNMIGLRLVAPKLLRTPALMSPHKIVKRRSNLIPPDQYQRDHDIWPKKFQFMYVMKNHWECIPLFTVTGIAIAACLIATLWAFRNKVDILLSTGHRENISRTMDLRNPSTHKMIIINQRYLPWPEMQDVLDKMTLAEKRAKVRLETCKTP